MTGGVAQRSVLTPIILQIQANDMPEDLNNYMNLFADDAKIMKLIKDGNDRAEIEKDIHKIRAWCSR